MKRAGSLSATLGALRLGRRSVRGRLVGVVLLITLIVLLVSGSAFVVYDLAVYRASWANDVASEADILAQAAAQALATGDRKLAAQNLGAMRARPSVLLAVLYAPDGAIFTAYQREGEAQALPRLPLGQGLALRGERVEFARRMEHGGAFLGTLYLQARYDVLGRLGAYAGIFAAVMILGVLLALLLSASLQQAVTEPLEEIAGVAGQIVDRRDYSLRVTRSTGGEIGIVVRALNAMLDEVQRGTRALEQSNASLQGEVIERHAAEAALAEANTQLESTMAQLREADRRKDEFLATLAHELRNPLAPIGNASRLLGMPGASAEQQRWAREVIARQVQHMALLLDDLLDVSRITRGRLELRKELVGLARLVSSAVETARPLIDARRHSLRVDLPGGPVELEVDPLRISQVLCNLLTNAAKYTEPGGRIELVATVDGQGLAVAVGDNGAGLGPEAMAHVFEMFFQVEGGHGRGQGGLGIGLALSRGLLALHGGTLEVASEGEGRGATFTMRLPASLLAPEASPEALSRGPAEPPSPAGKILVADDNRDAADSLAALLRMLGRDVAVAYSGDTALEQALTLQPRFLILDIGMPQLSGHEVARRVRQEQWGADATLIALTGWGQQQDLDRAREAGFDHHFRKPVELNDLLALLEKEES